MTKIGFIGAGQMARALASGFVAANKVAGRDVHCCDPSTAAVQAMRDCIPELVDCEHANALVQAVDVAFLAVKPQQMASVFGSLRQAAPCLMVSIAAGVTIRKLTDGLSTDRVIRVMPNTPCLVGAGAAGYCRGDGASEEDADRVGELLNSVGIAYEVPETLLDAVTGVSGSGPAFVYQFIEALSDGGVRMGLPRQVATQLAAQTVLGAAKMVLETDTHPGALKDQVTSPGGTTIAGIHALECGQLRGTVMNAVQAATQRAQEMG